MSFDAGLSAEGRLLIALRRVYLALIFAALSTVLGIFTMLGLGFLGENNGQGGRFAVIEVNTKSWRFDSRVISGGEFASTSASPTTGGFANSTIKVKAGSRVILHIANLESNQPHGFGLPDFGVQTVTIAPGQKVEVKFFADREGTFTFFCTVFCGTGHPQHKGILVVTS